MSVWYAVIYVLFRKSHKKNRIITTSIGKFYCRAHTNDFQFANYYYEWGVKRFIIRQLPNYDVFMDIGACIGEYSLLASNSGLRCLAFEPVESNYEVLKQNIELNHKTDLISAFNHGLGSQSETVHFYFNPVNTGASHFTSEAKISNCKASIVTLDSIIDQFNLKKSDRILIKLDIEGMEPAAIQGAARFINSFDNIMIVAEDKHSGECPIRLALSQIASFEFGKVDQYNISARKFIS